MFSLVLTAQLLFGAPEEPFEFSRGRYETIEEACVGEAVRLAPAKWVEPITRYCHYRTYHATRGVRVVSRVDQSWTHDVDRPKAWIFVRNAVRVGAMSPLDCPYHQIRPKRHPKGCHKLANNWPFQRWAPMDASDMSKWMAKSHDFEKHGTRGPHDHTAAYSYLIMHRDGLPTCWPYWWLDDPGVAAHITVRKALHRCRNAGKLTGFARCTFKTIRDTW
jgi:hypothetical protein